jgi:Domain of unknown function (DUF1906)
MIITAREVGVQLGTGVGFDTSQSLTAEQYATLKGLGFTWAVRYVPLSGGAPAGIDPTERDACLGAGLGLMLVQYARSSFGGLAPSTFGEQDGAAAAAAAMALSIPPSVRLWLDLAITSSGAAIAYANSWAAGATRGGWAPSALGVYIEPGVPLSASDRYSKLSVQNYWATGADDQNRFPTARGCQLVQAWVSPRGEYEPAPGILIDADVAWTDYRGVSPVAAFGAL